MIMPSTRRRRVNKPAAKQRSKIYALLGNRFLLVPALDMWGLHEASKPSSIAARAGLGHAILFYWQKKYEGKYPWLTDWLYATPGVSPTDGFHPTVEMPRFREHATI